MPPAAAEPTEPTDPIEPIQVTDATGSAAPAAATDAAATDAAAPEGEGHNPSDAAPPVEASTPAQTAARLAALFPALFAGAPKPLKLRIQADIQARAPGVFTKQALSAFLRRHTGATAYLIATTKAAHRFDLDGQPAGELSDEHREVAAAELTRRRALRDARREEELKGRRERASLLRDFERTTLTEANFCALKGVDAAQLAGVLAQAREEAKEDAARASARPDHHRGDRGGRDDRGPRGPRPDGGRPGAGPGPRRDARGGPGPRRDGPPGGAQGKPRSKP